MFEDKIITFISVDGEEFKARVISCVKDVGISIVNANNSNDFLYCLHMKNSPQFKSTKGQISITRKQFTEMRKGIIDGHVDRSHVRNWGAKPSASTCPFGI